MYYYINHGRIDESWGYGGYELLVDSNSYFTKNEQEIVDSLATLFKNRKNFTNYSVIIWDETTPSFKLTELLITSQQKHLGIIDLVMPCGVNLDEKLRMKAKWKNEREAEELERLKKEELAKTAIEQERREKEQLKRLYEKYGDICSDDYDLVRK